MGDLKRSIFCIPGRRSPPLGPFIAPKPKKGAPLTPELIPGCRTGRRNGRKWTELSLKWPNRHPSLPTDVSVVMVMSPLRSPGHRHPHPLPRERRWGRGGKRLDPGVNSTSLNAHSLRVEELFKVSAGLHARMALWCRRTGRSPSSTARRRGAVPWLDLRRLRLREGLETRRRLLALAQGAG